MWQPSTAQSRRKQLLIGTSRARRGSGHAVSSSGWPFPSAAAMPRRTHAHDSVHERKRSRTYGGMWTGRN